MDAEKSHLLADIFLMPAITAYSENAKGYFNRGLKSESTRTKIKYFSKALEMAPNLAEAYEKRVLLLSSGLRFCCCLNLSSNRLKRNDNFNNLFGRLKNNDRCAQRKEIISSWCSLGSLL